MPNASKEQGVESQRATRGEGSVVCGVWGVGGGGWGVGGGGYGWRVRQADKQPKGTIVTPTGR